MNKLRKKTMKRIFLTIVSILIPVLALLVFLGLISAGTMSFSGTISKNIFQFRTLGDWVIVLLLVVSILFTNLYLFTLIKKKDNRVTKPIGLIISIVTNEMLILFIIPIKVLGLDVSSTNVQRVVSNTKIFYPIAIGIMIAGIIALMFLLKERLYKNNWWLFLIALPHILIGWAFQRDYQGFHSFIQSSDFSYQKVAEMLNHTDLDLLMLNPSWFKCIAIIILNLILLIGLILYDFIWQKTKRWCIKEQ